MGQSRFAVWNDRLSASGARVTHSQANRFGRYISRNDHNLPYHRDVRMLSAHVTWLKNQVRANPVSLTPESFERGRRWLRSLAFTPTFRTRLNNPFTAHELRIIMNLTNIWLVGWRPTGRPVFEAEGTSGERFRYFVAWTRADAINSGVRMTGPQIALIGRPNAVQSGTIFRSPSVQITREEGLVKLTIVGDAYPIFLPSCEAALSYVTGQPRIHNKSHNADISNVLHAYVRIERRAKMRPMMEDVDPEPVTLEF